MSNRGRFVWYDLMTTDVEGAKAFYGEVIGWKAEATDASPMPYTMWKLGDQGVGGMMELPPQARQQGAPPHWIGYVVVDDVDRTCARSKELGGRVLTEPMDVPGAGRFAVVMDPQGGVIAPFAPQNDVGGDGPTDRPGQIGWHELNATDYEAAWSFYQELFAWTHAQSMEMPDGGVYWMFQRAGVDGSTGGMSSAAAQHGVPAHWLFYINVDDLDAAMERVKTNGGEVLAGPIDIPGDGRIAHCTDPQKAMFALVWMPDPDAA
ncbi:MAG: VOC family protein [Sandaracinaceae bacterium]